jgi:glycerol-3-phosphate dehydrogenase (NAD(P)+)
MNCLVLGAGAWGTAMALHLHRCGHAVTLAPRRLEHALTLASARENSDYLPGYALPHSIQIGSELTPLLMEAEALFFATPAKALRETAEAVAAQRAEAWQLRYTIALCKGVEAGTHKLPCEVLDSVFPDLINGALSGPTFAHEVAAEKPTAVVLAMNADAAPEFQAAVSNAAMRAYWTEDRTGVELGATLKNIYAIGAGMCDGLDLGANAKAAYITRVLQEMVTVGIALGGQRETFFGLSGFGDLVATCHGPLSRNRTLGFELAKGSSVTSVLSARKSVTEGVTACGHLAAWCQERGLEAPILFEIHAVLEGQKEPAEALRSLMTRSLKPETGK